MKAFGYSSGTNRATFTTKLKTRIQYFSDNSTVASFGHVITLSRTPFFKRLFWLLTFSACCYGSTIVLRGALGLYIQNAVSYSVETDYLHWDTTFPALTICEQSSDAKVNEALKKYPTSLLPFAKEIIYWNPKICKTCLNCKMNTTCIEDFLPFVDLARSPCDEVLTICSYNGEEFPCCERFKPIATEYGVCFVFNSELTGDGNLKVNRKTGLPSLIFNAVAKVTVIVHSPEERVTVATEKILGTCYTLSGSNNFEVNVLAEEIINDISVRSIPPANRDCLFKNDQPPESLVGWPFDEYSYSSCVWYCRTMAQINMCNCSHHFMPKIEKYPICTTEGLKCLHINRQSLDSDNCHCPMSCNEVTYKPIYVTCPKNSESRVIQGTVKIGQFPHLRVRRQAIRDMLGLVVDIGGVAGVFFGASVLSFIEIIYIFCIRKYP